MKTEESGEKYRKRLAALNAVSKTVSTSLNLGEILSSTIDKILEADEPDSVRIYLLDDRKKVLNLVAHKGLSTDFINKPIVRSRKPGHGLLGQTAVDGETKVIDNIQQSNIPHVHLFTEEGLQTTAYIH